MTDVDRANSAKWKSHPDYQEGFDDRMEGTPERSQSEPYQAGYVAARNLKALLERNGFSDDGDGNFSKAVGSVSPTPTVLPGVKGT